MVADISLANEKLSKILSRWSLWTGLAYLALLIFFFAVEFPAMQDSPLSEEYNELILAAHSAVISRAGIVLAMSYWLLIGGFFILCGILLFRFAPIRSMLLAALGAGQFIGALGSIEQLNSLGSLAARYATALPDQQSALLQSFVDLRLNYTADFETSGLFWAIALLLLASAMWSTSAFPRWLSGLIGFSGVAALLNFAVMLISGQYNPPVVSEMLLMIILFAVAVVSRKAGQKE